MSNNKKPQTPKKQVPKTGEIRKSPSSPSAGQEKTVRKSATSPSFGPIKPKR